jgi:hypothetical protein
MPAFELPISGPLSGDVSQFIAPWSVFFNPSHSSFSAITVNLGRSSAPDVEKDVLAEVGSYGKQLGRIGDALAVLMAHFKPDRALSEKEQRAIDALKGMLIDIDDIKTHRGRAAGPET